MESGKEPTINSCHIILEDLGLIRMEKIPFWLNLNHIWGQTGCQNLPENVKKCILCKFSGFLGTKEISEITR